MSKLLLSLMRHASALVDSKDHERKLSPVGHQESRSAGLELAKVGLDRVLCSTALRAAETCEEVCGQLEHQPAIEFERGLYLAEPDIIFERLSELPLGAEHVLVIAHNPGVQQLAWDLAAGSSLRAQLRAGMPPATLVHFEGEASDWSELRSTQLRPLWLWSPGAGSPVHAMESERG